MQIHGFEVVRRLVSASACSSLRADVLARVTSSRHAAVERIVSDLAAGREGRMEASTVRSPEHRAHVSLPLNPKTREALTLAATGVRGAFLRAGLDPATARLVELSAMVAFPGAAAQTPHTDIPPYSPPARRLCTLWVALQDVTRSMGPTMVHPCPPKELCDRAAAQGFVDTDTGEEGMAPTARGEEKEDITLRVGGRRRRPRRRLSTHQRQRSDPWAPGRLDLPPAVAMEMEAGDACVVDGRYFHFGSANESVTPRVLLSASFESTTTTAGSLLSDRPAVSSEEGIEDGFTYEVFEGLEGKYTLGDFVIEQAEQGPTRHT